MNNQSPLVPQGTIPPKGRSNVQIAVFTIVALHVVFIGGFLLIGCKDTTQQPVTPVSNPETAVQVVSNTPPPVTPPPPITSNVAPVVATNAAPLTSPHAAPDAPPVSAPKEYLIAKGDTLDGIAHKFHIKRKALEDANPGVNPLKLQIGITKLKIPDTAAAPTSGDTTVTGGTTSSDENIYVVKAGDALEKIAKANHTTVKAIVELNHLKSMNSIKAGQKLKLPGAKPAAVPDATAPPPVAPPAAPAAPGTGTAAPPPAN